MAEKKNETVEDTQTVDSSEVEQVQGEVLDKSEAATEQTEGTRARRAFMLKQFVPNPDWINKNIVAHGKGTRATVGRIFGIATGYEDRTNTLPSGEVVSSIAVKGDFQAENYISGEISSATMVFFPMAYAEKIKTTFLADKDVRTLEVDCDVGLEATGKTIPYEWVIVAFREGAEMGVMKRLRSSRAKPAVLLASPDGKPLLTAAAPAAIEDKTAG